MNSAHLSIFWEKSKATLELLHLTLNVNSFVIYSFTNTNIVKNCRLSTQIISVIIVLFSPCNCVAAHLLHKCSIRSILKELCINRELLAFFLIKLQFSS